MKKRILALLLTALLGLTACAPAGTGETPRLTVAATTYPVYLFANTLTAGVEGVAVDRLNTGETSCLHDYTLSVSDMKLLERADVVAMSGAGLEEFLEDALAASPAAVIDCSVGVDLLENAAHHHDEEDHSHDGHDHGHFDPHYWLDPERAAVMVDNLREGLSLADPANAALYESRAEEMQAALAELPARTAEVLGEKGREGLITFHDGFRYFAYVNGLPLLKAIEEEAGSEASAREIVEVTALVREHRLPVIFTEVNGSDATANAIVRETGCRVAALTMIMDGPGDGDLSVYIDGILSNAAAVAGGFAGEEGVTPK